MAEHHERKHDTHRQLIERLRRQAEDIRRLTSGLDEERLAGRLIPDKWSLKELVCHSWRVQRLFEDRMNAMLSEDNPHIEPYAPEGDPEFDTLTARSTEESLAGFLKDRARLTDRLERLSPSQWHRRGEHPEFPHYDVHFQIEYMAHHEAHHIYQMFQRRAPLAPVPH